MAKTTKNVTQAQLNRILGIAGLLIALLLIVGAGLAYFGRNFAVNQVRSQLVQERIKFPPKGSKSLDPNEYPGLQQYAGQMVDSGKKAKAYADEYIWHHMMKSSGGKSYAEISDASRAKPDDQKLAALKNSLFQGDMLRSSLLTAYAFSVFGIIAGYAIVVCLAGAALALLFSLTRFVKARK